MNNYLKRHVTSSCQPRLPLARLPLRGAKTNAT